MPAETPAELLAAYDAQLRARVPDPIPAGETVERDGPRLRFSRGHGGGWVLYRDLAGIEGKALDDLIARQIAAFAARGEHFEWKYHGHDLPADLPDRLKAAGFQPDDQETIVVASVADITGDVVLGDRVVLREVTTRGDFDRIAGLEQAVWGEYPNGLAEMLDAEQSADPEGITVVVAEASSTVVCAAWIRFDKGTDFASLWGGATLEKWRRRGI